jgi:hypothetical protein
MICILEGIATIIISMVVWLIMINSFLSFTDFIDNKRNEKLYGKKKR